MQAPVPTGELTGVEQTAFITLHARSLPSPTGSSRSRARRLRSNGYSRMSSRLMAKVVPATRRLAVDISDGFDDPLDVERWNPDLTFAERRHLVRTPYVDAMPTGYRLQCKTMADVPFLTRLDMGVLRYTY